MKITTCWSFDEEETISLIIVFLFALKFLPFYFIHVWRLKIRNGVLRKVHRCEYVWLWAHFYFRHLILRLIEDESEIAIESMTWVSGCLKSLVYDDSFEIVQSIVFATKFQFKRCHRKKSETHDRHFRNFRGKCKPPRSGSNLMVPFTHTNCVVFVVVVWWEFRHRP